MSPGSGEGGAYSIPHDSNVAQETKTPSDCTSSHTREINDSHTPEDATASDCDSGAEPGLERTGNIADADLQHLAKEGDKNDAREGEKSKSDEANRSRLNSALVDICLSSPLFW